MTNPIANAPCCRGAHYPAEAKVLSDATQAHAHQEIARQQAQYPRHAAIRLHHLQSTGV